MAKSDRRAPEAWPGRTHPFTVPPAVGVTFPAVPVVSLDRAAAASRLKSRCVVVDEKDVWGAPTNPPQQVGNTMTELRDHVSRGEEITRPVQTSAREQGRDLAERYQSAQPADSLDEPTEHAYLLRERMTRLQSQMELAQAQLSSMRSGKASKDLYARVFVPLMDELEEASRQYAAVMAMEAQGRRPAASTRRHRRSLWLQLHRSMNLSG
jgi:hypothetical protein